MSGLWAIIPAAGVGKRVGGATPKQYLELHGQPILEWTINRLLAIDELTGLVVVVSESDEYWGGLSMSQHEKILRAPGGTERCHSVLSGLLMLQGQADSDDWVLVHDAARPCVRQVDIAKLIHQCQQHNNGGILAMPVRDTMKRANEDQRIADTVDRSALWHALTPQCFRFGELFQALSQALKDGYEVTDEASAMEYAGHHPLLVEGHSDNIKVTLPQDLALAAHFLQEQESL